MTTSEGAPGSIEHLVAECRRIEEFAQANAAVHFIHAERSATIAKWVAVIPLAIGGVLGGIVAADPGLTSDGAGRWLSAAALGIAGGISSVISAWSPDKARVEHNTAGGHYKTLENEARRTHELYAREEGKDALMRRVRDLSRQYDDLGESSPATEDWAFKKAMERVTAGTYRPDSFVAK
jgi:hypothetical protein